MRLIFELAFLRKLARVNRLRRFFLILDEPEFQLNAFTYICWFTLKNNEQNVLSLLLFLAEEYVITFRSGMKAFLGSCHSTAIFLLLFSIELAEKCCYVKLNGEQDSNCDLLVLEVTIGPQCVLRCKLLRFRLSKNTSYLIKRASVCHLTTSTAL